MTRPATLPFAAAQAPPNVYASPLPQRRERDALPFTPNVYASPFPQRHERDALPFTPNVYASSSTPSVRRAPNRAT